MVELLSPAGNFEKMKAAIRYGADAVYLAGHFFGMRSAYYIQRLRVSHAVFYLSLTSYDIAAVSDFCGFNSPSHLVLCHKKQTGMLPKYLRYRLKEYYERNPESKRSVKF